MKICEINKEAEYIKYFSVNFTKVKPQSAIIAPNTNAKGKNAKKENTAKPTNQIRLNFVISEKSKVKSKRKAEEQI
jgi:hypothetical protein